MSSTGWFGNEACQGTMYVSSAIILTLPTMEERLKSKDAENNSAKDAVNNSALHGNLGLNKIRMGEDHATEIAFAKSRYEAFQRIVPEFSREEIEEVATVTGVSKKGLTNAIMARVQKQARAR